VEKFKGEAKDRMELWRHYKLGIPGFVPVLKCGLIEECNNAIVGLLEAEAGVRERYPKPMSWEAVLMLAWAKEMVSEKAIDTALKLGMDHGLIDGSVELVREIEDQAAARAEVLRLAEEAGMIRRKDGHKEHEEA
jgi:hypothetical protein